MGSRVGEKGVTSRTSGLSLCLYVCPKYQPDTVTGLRLTQLARYYTESDPILSFVWLVGNIFPARFSYGCFTEDVLRVTAFLASCSRRETIIGITFESFPHSVTGLKITLHYLANS
jgi:hypothetical protein